MKGRPFRKDSVLVFDNGQPLRKLSEQPCHFPSATMKDENRGASAGTPYRKSGLSGRIAAGVKRSASRRRVFSEQLLFEKKLLIPAIRRLVSLHPRQHDVTEVFLRTTKSGS
jgi:hypothetical protein